MDDVIQVHDQYYILATASRASERTSVLKHDVKRQIELSRRIVVVDSDGGRWRQGEARADLNGATDLHASCDRHGPHHTVSVPT